VKNKRNARKSEVERLLALIHPHLERVKKPRRTKRHSVADGISPEAVEMRVHAASWIGAHGHAYRDLAQRLESAGSGKRKVAKSERESSALILVRPKGGKLKHPPHPAKHVLISRTTGKIRGEQG
jgi:hypothetical protein